MQKTDALAARLRRRAASGERVDLTAEVTRLALAIVAEVTMGWTDIDELEDALAAGTAVLQSGGLIAAPVSPGPDPAKMSARHQRHDRTLSGYQASTCLYRHGRRWIRP